MFRFNGANLGRGELWIKDDRHLTPLYGGNKARKLGPILDAAVRAGARRILTAGAAGSHHVLATTLFARQRGLAAAAVLSPQPRTEHAVQTLWASLASGLEAHPVSATAETPLTLLERRASGDYLLPIGGWGVQGSLPFVAAVAELRSQIDAGELPPPDVVVVALGSGGTCAGLLAGACVHGLGFDVHATCVFSRSRWMARAQVIPLAARLASRAGQQVDWRRLHERLHVDVAELGAGYGHVTPRAAVASELGAASGLELDATYTAKAFAAALALAGCRELSPWPASGPAEPHGRGGPGSAALRVLYWHTLSGVAPTPIETGARLDALLPERLRCLFHGS